MFDFFYKKSFFKNCFWISLFMKKKQNFLFIIFKNRDLKEVKKSYNYYKSKKIENIFIIQNYLKSKIFLVLVSQLYIFTFKNIKHIINL